MSVSRSGEPWRVSKTSALRGALRPPGDKSISHRAVILGALARGETRVDGWLAADDCLRTLAIVRRLGVRAEETTGGSTLHISGVGLRGLHAPAGNEPLDCGNSGTTMRLMLGVLAAHDFRCVLTGDDSLRRRPMRRIVEPLRMMGAVIEGADDGGYAPLEVRGAVLRGSSFELPVASAQVKSCILLAGLQASGTTRVREPSPSRDHTERQLRRLGAAYRAGEDGWHAVEGGVQFDARDIRVPGDISSAAFFLAAGAICPRSEIEITGVGVNPGRSGFLEVMRRMGARITLTNEREEDGEPVADIIVRGGARLKGVRVAGELVPRMIDEIPILAVLACFAEGITVIRDAAELRAKESDRIASVAEELQKMGARVGMLADGLAIEGGAPLRGTEMKSHGDHRVAQAMAVAALGADGQSTVEGTACVETSNPSFWRDLSAMGAAS